MKKILGLAAGMMLTIATFAQGSVTFLDANASYDKTAVTSFNFEFSSEYTVEQINKAAEFYTAYFTVKPVASPVGNTVTITLVEDNEMARRVITRFFVTMEIQKILVNGESYTISDFGAKYLML
jgi:hypothetical protein